MVSDPLEFLAESLRKQNMQQRLETEEMLIASIRIQARPLTHADSLTAHAALSLSSALLSQA
jgi:hypothetical protein